MTAKETRPREPQTVREGHSAGAMRSAAGGGNGRRLGQVLVRGLAGLVEAQRCFAEEFGLPHDRVFSAELEEFKGRKPEEVLREWLSGGEEGLGRLQSLFEDLAQHQLALVGGLDGIALEAVAQMENNIRTGGGGRRPFWRFLAPSRRTLRRQLLSDSTLRHVRVVMPGFVHGYVRARVAARNR